MTGGDSTQRHSTGVIGLSWARTHSPVHPVVRSRKTTSARIRSGRCMRDVQRRDKSPGRRVKDGRRNWSREKGGGRRKHSSDSPLASRVEHRNFACAKRETHLKMVLPILEVRCWKFDVRCSTFDVRYFISVSTSNLIPGAVLLSPVRGASLALRRELFPVLIPLLSP